MMKRICLLFLFKFYTFVSLSLLSSAIFAAENANPEAWKDIKHVVVIILENENADDALRQPFMNSLTKTGAYLKQSYAITHPSQPNYIAMVAGSTYSVSGDGNVNLTGKTIADLFNAKGLTWKSYAEQYPGNCYLGGSNGEYARKHEPFISFTGVQKNATECAKIVPGPQFFSDLAANRLPTFSYYVPDEKNDGHDTGVAYADSWLKNTFGPIFNNPTVMKDTLFIITFDEDDFTSVNRIYTVFVGAGVKPGANTVVHYDHYNLLRTIEDIFGLGNLGKNDTTAQPILDIWATATPPTEECLIPKNIQTSFTPDKRSITINWQKPDITLPVLGYQVNDWQNVLMWKGTALSFTDNTLPGNNGVFSYYLYTNCSTGLSKSIEVQVTISDIPPPPPQQCLPPANIRATWSSDRRAIMLTWQQPANSAPISNYQVNDYLNNFMWKGTALQFTDESLPGRPGSYRYYLYSNCASGLSNAVPYDVNIP